MGSLFCLCLILLTLYLSFPSTAAELGCPTDWQYCDHRCRVSGFKRGICDKATSTCKCEIPRLAAMYGCPMEWIHCHRQCRRFGNFDGICTRYGQCYCEDRKAPGYLW